MIHTVASTKRLPSTVVSVSRTQRSLYESIKVLEFANYFMHVRDFTNSVCKYDLLDTESDNKFRYFQEILKK